MSRVKVGKYFLNSDGVNPVVQVIAPATNTQGAILRTIFMFAGPSTGLAAAFLYADTSAPSVAGDASKRLIAQVNALGNTTNGIIVPYEIEVPAGLGVWIGQQLGGRVELTWDLISV
ncbi:hypothetical protein Herbaro_11260 [Herbaspirillum sp. WKF16]|jgi:hypothetical protein|uniref:hypothetical protein n=1 Tax=Herbaspirillum sp. WKF16 TaxID=3028312 RepID=UPI0023AA0BFA|nr:hypothetical protein [Herbaspirillum sp. WKF16]WDZ98337.1 hypothetical protein Herbaro_11260 [Herbaspirillum sp. WKF16]